MDWGYIIAVFTVGASMFILGRMWSIRDMAELKQRYSELLVKYHKLTDRDKRGRFIKRENRESL